MREFTIQKNEANQRLDKYLKKLLPNAGSSFLYKMLRKKNITLDGKKADGTEILAEGSLVKIFFSKETFEKFGQDQSLVKSELDELALLPMNGLRIVYEDDQMLAADKPANMLSQKAADRDISANERLLGYLVREKKLTAAEYETFHPSVCNRLDRNTTGLILMGKTLAALQELSRGLKDRSIHKYYQAVVIGNVQVNTHIRAWLYKDPAANQVTILKKPAEGAVPIETAYRTLQAGPEYSLLEIELITGKTHQIRAHLASVGCPVLGDPKYGKEDINRKVRSRVGMTHQMLHAWKLVMPDGRQIISEPPALFQRVMKMQEY